MPTGTEILYLNRNETASQHRIKCQPAKEVTKMIAFPVLVGEMAKRGIKKNAIARSLGICDKALYNKLNGRVPFTWPEVLIITSRFFPDFRVEDLFSSITDHTGE